LTYDELEQLLEALENEYELQEESLEDDFDK